MHHTATATGSVSSIDAAHRRRTDAAGRPWRGIGYHFLIGNGNGMADGLVEPTFRWNEQLDGAHAGHTEWNQTGIGIALVGNFELCPPTPAQLAAVSELVQSLRWQYSIPANQVTGHSAVRATLCPGRFFPLRQVAGPDQLERSVPKIRDESPSIPLSTPPGFRVKE